MIKVEECVVKGEVVDDSVLVGVLCGLFEWKCV